MSEKRLPVHQPILTSYCYYASLTSLLQEAKDFSNWLYGNFISLRISRSGVLCYGKSMSPTFITPWTTSHRYGREMIRVKWEFIVDFVIDALDRDHYVFLKVNRKYFPSFNGYQKWNSVHELFIYGYDRERQILFIGDNMDEGKYVFAQCSFEEFTQAYEDTKKDSYGGVILATMDREKSCEFDLSRFRERLEEYLNPRGNIFLYNPLPMGVLPGDLKNDPCGTDIYPCIFHDLDEKLKEEELSRLDRRLFFLLWEHKKLMLARLHYLNEEKIHPVEEAVLSGIGRTEELFKILLNLSLKYNAAPDRAIPERMKGYLQEGIDRESEALRRLISTL
ncbi:MAG: hypothetical protein PQJ60_14530 [Spirochaetales bacterium]|nr:hypothetical protein [Spirochaetales bacterium]